MPRPKFVPTADQRRAIDHLAKLSRQADLIDQQLDKAIAVAAGKAIPVSVIADAVGWQRKTVYRHLGHDM